MIFRGSITALVLLSTAAMAAPDQNDIPVASTNLFVSGQDGYHTYRIPSLVVTTRGTLLAFAEGRKQTSGDAGDIEDLKDDLDAFNNLGCGISQND